MKDFELEFLTKLIEQSDAGNLDWDEENREFTCSFRHKEIFIVTLTLPSIPKPHFQLLITSHLPQSEDKLELIRLGVRATDLLSKEDVDLLARLRDSAVNYVNVIKEQQRIECIKKGINYLELKGKSSEVDYTTGEHWQFAKP